MDIAWYQFHSWKLMFCTFVFSILTHFEYLFYKRNGRSVSKYMASMVMRMTKQLDPYTLKAFDSDSVFGFVKNFKLKQDRMRCAKRTS